MPNRSAGELSITERILLLRARGKAVFHPRTLGFVNGEFDSAVTDLNSLTRDGWLRREGMSWAHTPDSMIEADALHRREAEVLFDDTYMRFLVLRALRDRAKTLEQIFTFVHQLRVRGDTMGLYNALNGLRILGIAEFTDDLHRRRPAIRWHLTPRGRRLARFLIG